MTTLADQNTSALIEIKESGKGEMHRILCNFGGLQENRLKVTSPQRIAPFTTLSVEYNDVLFLGEVIACTQDCANQWHVEIGVEQMLNGLQSLVRLRARLLGEPVPALGSRTAFASR